MSSKKSLKIFLIEDNPGDVRLIKEYLREEFEGQFEFVNAKRLREALEKLSDESGCDVILCDLSLPDSHGYDTFLDLHNEYPHIPVVVLTGKAEETVGIEAVKGGAQDFLSKDDLIAPILKRSLLYAIERSRAQKVSQIEIIEGQERERKRVAEELHDGIGQLLSAINLNLKKLESKAEEWNKEYQQSYYNALKLLDQAVREVRNISHNLMPDVLENFGLIKAIEHLCEDLKGGEKLQVDFYHNEIDHRFNRTIEITLYRVTQELIANALKHAQADYIQIQLIEHKKRLVLSVEDNGRGFREDEIQNKSGIGLKNTEKRIKSLNGKLMIDSEKEKGTAITVELPL